MGILSRLAMPRNILAIIGTTGVGKSQYAVDVAAALPQGMGGVVLSADSMQLYEGLEVITNKVTEGEMRGVEHWGVGEVAVGSGGTWEVGRWCGEAWGKIESMNPLTQLPIICGGTHYYTQHFLFPPSRLSLDRSASAGGAGGSRGRNDKWKPGCGVDELLDTLDSMGGGNAQVAARIREEPGVRAFLGSFYTPQPVFPPSWIRASSPPTGNPDAASTTTFSDPELLALHRLLELVDPQEAGRWHWRDGRKVKRGLERWWEGVEGGCRGADGVEGREEAEVETLQSRFRTLIFWVYDDLETLAPRLDRRVDKMVELGLIDEIKQLREQAVRIYGTEQNIDHEEGIFQSIGYKEFSHIPTDRLKPSDPLFAPALERMKISTRQYAKRQLKWVQKQLLPVVRQAMERQRRAGEDDGVWVYVVRGGEVDKALGEEITHRFLNHLPMPDYRTVGHPKAGELLSILDVDGGLPVGDAGDSSVIVPDIQQRQVLNARLECEICSTPSQPVTIIKSEWNSHLKSKSHRRSKFRWERENGLAPDWTAVREEAARRKAVKEEEARAAQERLDQEDGVDGVGA